MHKTMTTMIASISTAMLLISSPAWATVYSFTFESVDGALTASGEMTVSAADEVTAISGAISGLVDQTIASVVPNPNFSGPAYSPDGSFIYNNLYHPAGMAFDVYGVLFATAENPGGYWNLWATFPGAYALWESAELLQLPDGGDRDPERGRRAGIVDLGDAGPRLRLPWRRRPGPLAAPSGRAPQLGAKPAKRPR